MTYALIVCTANPIADLKLIHTPTAAVGQLNGRIGGEAKRRAAAAAAAKAATRAKACAGAASAGSKQRLQSGDRALSLTLIQPIQGR